jgi:hypothetical protein
MIVGGLRIPTGPVASKHPAELFEYSHIILGILVLGILVGGHNSKVSIISSRSPLTVVIKQCADGGDLSSKTNSVSDRVGCILCSLSDIYCKMLLTRTHMKLNSSYA